MGTYSEIAAAMQRRDYEEMLKSVSQHQHKKELEDFFQEADKLVLGETTSIDSLDVVNGNSPEDVIVLHWPNYKMWSIGEDEFLNDWCDRHGGDYVRVGKESDDIVKNLNMYEISVGETTVDWQAGDTRYDMKEVLEKIALQCGGAKAMADKYAIPEERLTWMQLQEKFMPEDKKAQMADAVNLADAGQRGEFLGQIIDVFEDFLEEQQVKVPAPEGSEIDEQDNVRLCGSHYDKLHDALENLMVNWQVMPGLPRENNAVLTPGELAAEINSFSNEPAEKLRMVENIKSIGFALVSNDRNNMIKNR